MSARDDYPAIADIVHGADVRGHEEMAAALDEIDRLRAITDNDVTFSDLELKMRDGTIDLRAITDPNEDRTSHAAAKFLAALMLHFLYGDDAANPPPNYRSGHIKIRPGGSYEEYECSIEVRMPHGKSSHDIRLELEARIDQARARIEADSEMHGDTIDELLRILEHTPAPPQPPAATETDWK